MAIVTRDCQKIYLPVRLGGLASEEIDTVVVHYEAYVQGVLVKVFILMPDRTVSSATVPLENGVTTFGERFQNYAVDVCV